MIQTQSKRKDGKKNAEQRHSSINKPSWDGKTAYEMSNIGTKLIRRRFHKKERRAKVEMVLPNDNNSIRIISMSNIHAVHCNQEGVWKDNKKIF
jgi:hypothetical protein